MLVPFNGLDNLSSHPLPCRLEPVDEAGHEQEERADFDVAVADAVGGMSSSAKGEDDPAEAAAEKSEAEASKVCAGNNA